MYLDLIMWSNHGITCQRSSGEGTRLYQKSHPPHSSVSAASQARLRGFMTNLQGPGRVEHLLNGSLLVALDRHEDADQVVAEARVEGDAFLVEQRAEQDQGRHRAERPEQDGQLKGDDHVRRNRGDRLPADQG